MNSNKLAREKVPPSQTSFPFENVLAKVSWVFAAGMVVLALVLAIWRPAAIFSDPEENQFSSQIALATLPSSESGAAQTAQLPAYDLDSSYTYAVSRQVNVHTDMPERSREGVEEYTVEAGDSLFAISKSFNLKPETILWANYDSLHDNPDTLTIGMNLKIPPTNGILYKWKEGDTLESVAAKYKAKLEDILAWPGNQLDMTNPKIDTGALVMIPGGSRSIVTWVVPTIARGRAGVNKTISGPGACETGEGGLVGGANFRWPTNGPHALSGNDYWSGHLGIDISADLGTPVLASDSGVVVYAGVISGGYGNMVMIDHGNGWQTLYAHLSSILTSCGASVAQGTPIALSGSTGNSTGPHLHFEVRYGGGFVNPWDVLH